MKQQITEKSISAWHIWGLVLFVLIGWSANIFLVPRFYGNPEDAAAFGDMFGAVNALFSGLAFVGVVVAILLQRKELELQRKELESTRLELEGQKLQLEEQNATLRKQSFENTYFQLLKLYNDLVASIDIESEGSRSPFAGLSKSSSTPKPPSTGRDGFVTLYGRYTREVFDEIREKHNLSTTVDIASYINSEYEKFFDLYQSDLGHYFRTIYNLLKFIDKSDVENKPFYTDILRAQLSSHELLHLHYNSISKFGRDKMLPLLTKYNILKHLPTSEKIEEKYIRSNDNKKKIDEERIKRGLPADNGPPKNT